MMQLRKRVGRTIVLFIFLWQLVPKIVSAQVGTGYFNGTVFSTYSSVNGGALSGNNFTVAYSGAYSTKRLATFTPGNLPANTGFPSPAPRSLELMASASNTSVTYTFTSPLPLYTTLFVEDVDVGESIRIEFLTVSSSLVNTSNIIYKTISTTGFSPIVFASNAITITSSATDFNEALMGFVINTTTVTAIRITQLSGSTGGTYIAYFGKPGLDHGDAAASYGDAAHLPSTTLKLGSLGAEAEATAAFSAGANGDDAGTSATIIDDEDGAAALGFLYTISTSYSVNITLANTTGASATLYGWIDFNNDGDFADANERSAVVTVANGATTATVSWTGLTGLVAGTPAIRFRIASNATEASSPTGNAASGEVEDYKITTYLLPLSLTNFSAVRTGDDINASWRTEIEVNVDHFELEYSTDGRNFSIGGIIPARNQDVNNYQFTLFNYNQPLYYLRLKSVDTNGKFKYSSVLVIRMNKAYTTAMQVTPNPVTEKMVVHITADMASNAQVAIYDAMGRVVYQSQQQLVKGDNSIYINSLANAARGTYVVQARVGNENLIRKIIIAR